MSKFGFLYDRIQVNINLPINERVDRKRDWGNARLLPQPRSLEQWRRHGIEGEGLHFPRSPKSSVYPRLAWANRVALSFNFVRFKHTPATRLPFSVPIIAFSPPISRKQCNNAMLSKRIKPLSRRPRRKWKKIRNRDEPCSRKPTQVQLLGVFLSFFFLFSLQKTSRIPTPPL